MSAFKFWPFKKNSNLSQIPKAGEVLLFVDDSGILKTRNPDGSSTAVADGTGLPDAPSDTKQYARKDGAWVEVVAASPKTFGITVDGAGAVLTTGSKGLVTIPYDCTITNWYLAADQAGDVVFDVKRSATSIIGTGNHPTLAAVRSANATVSGWTSAEIAAGDVLEFEITGTPATLTRVNLVIKAI